MHKLIPQHLLILFSLIGVIASGQNVIMKISEHGTNQRYPYTYINLDNTLELVVEGKMCKELILTTDNGTIKPSVKSCQYLFHPLRLDTATIYLATIDGKDTTIFKEIQLQTRTLQFKSTINGLVSDCKQECKVHLSKQQFLASGFWMAAINTNLSAKLPVASFEIRVVRNAAQIYKESVSAYNKESEKQLKENLAFIESGDIVELKEIRYKYPGGIWLNIDNVAIIIK